MSPGPGILQPEDEACRPGSLAGQRLPSWRLVEDWFARHTSTNNVLPSSRCCSFYPRPPQMWRLDLDFPKPLLLMGFKSAYVTIVIDGKPGHMIFFKHVFKFSVSILGKF